MVDKTKAKIQAKVFAKKYVENGMNGTKTIQQIRPHKTYQSARNQASEIIKRPEVQNEIVRIMESKGLTKEYLIDKAKEGLTANLVVDKQLSDVPDYAIRHKYLSTALKLHGELAESEKTATNQVNIGVVYIPREQDKPVKGQIIDQ